MEKYINESNKECWRGVTNDSVFDEDMFHLVECDSKLDEIQYALHTNIGSITVLDRRTGFGWRDVETGFRDVNGDFWLASCGCDVRDSESTTIGDAIEWIKKNANTCNPIRAVEL